MARMHFSFWISMLRYESSTLILYKELSSSTLQSCQSVSQWVRHAWHPSRSPLCAIYKGIDALYWPSIINYQLPTPHSDLYWPSTQLHHLVTHSWTNWIKFFTFCRIRHPRLLHLGDEDDRRNNNNKQLLTVKDDMGQFEGCFKRCGIAWLVEFDLMCARGMMGSRASKRWSF